MTRPEQAPEEEAARRGSPAAAVALVSGLLGLATAFNPSAPAVSLFFLAVAFAALPMALADRRDLDPERRRKADKQLALATAVAVAGLVALVVGFFSATQQDRLQDSRVVPTGPPVTPQASPRPSP